MSRIRGRNTMPERIMWNLLRELKSPPQRWTALPGKPDFVFEDASVAVFVDGCFWHRCPRHLSKPKTNKAFWLTKFNNNVARDLKVNQLLQSIGWDVFRFWECEIKKDPDSILAKIKRILESKLELIKDVRAMDL